MRFCFCVRVCGAVLLRCAMELYTAPPYVAADAAIEFRNTSNRECSLQPPALLMPALFCHLSCACVVMLCCAMHAVCLQTC